MKLLETDLYERPSWTLHSIQADIYEHAQKRHKFQADTFEHAQKCHFFSGILRIDH